MTTKEYVLKTLEENKGYFVTGMELASELGVSRNAIWKAINELKKDGYDIYSVNNRGYALDESSDILSVAAIKPFTSCSSIRAIFNFPGWPDSTTEEPFQSILIL